MKAILTIVIVITCIATLCLLWKPDKLLIRCGTRSYYAKNRYLLAEVRGEYLGDCFVPLMNILQRLNQEQKDNIVLIETIPDG
jgi:hypothetical protein